MTRWWLPFLWLVVLLLAVACGGGGEEVPAAPTTPPPDTGRPTPVVLNTPEPTPIITDGQFEAPTKGYSIRIPEDWIARPNVLPTATSSTDVFFAPEDESPVRTNIAVTCEQAEEGTSLEQYINRKRVLVTAVTGHAPQIDEGRVSGRDALVITFSLERQPAVDKIEVLFLEEERIWTVALSVPGGERESYRPVFEEFLASFQLLR